jgi:hypothetical protein
MLFIESPLFTRLVHDYLSDDEYSGLQALLMEHPESGVIIPGSGGVRKLRWSVAGRGKRGGIRVIYYWKCADDEIWMLTLYAKNERSTIPAHILRQIAEELEHG